jgi:uncharacterized protein
VNFAKWPPFPLPMGILRLPAAHKRRGIVLSRGVFRSMPAHAQRTNSLIHEVSPYLIQHAYNPVDWLPWGEAAFAKARAEGKPIFLSIGYSTCHWCHVMAHESFEDEAIAAVLNRDFVPVKVDREERPDVDRVYMLFVQVFSGSGGWPMSVWLTPELKPFYGGTYFAPDARYGRPGFAAVLKQIAAAWTENRDKIEDSSREIILKLGEIAAGQQPSSGLGRETADTAFQQFRRAFDTRWGGFGNAPKFPRPSALRFLTAYHALTGNAEALEMTAATLKGMAEGGVHDHLGGGFHRYSVDARWFVPHFEKMLYDQAQLAISYLEAFQITADPLFSRVAQDILDYVLRDMTNDAGAFYSAEDADSADPTEPGHKREGAFYVWTTNQIAELLEARQASLFCHHFGVQAEGNVAEDPHGEFTGQNILFESHPIASTAAEFQVSPEAASDLLRQASKILFEARQKRPRPHRDEKILTAWNSLMISALVKGYAVLGKERYLEAATCSARFILDRLTTADGRLLRRGPAGDGEIAGFLDDCAFFLNALLDLFESDPRPEYLDRALDLASRELPRFEDAEHGAFFSTTEGDPSILLRIKDEYDGAEPSGNAVAADALLRLARLTGDEGHAARAERALAALAGRVASQPTIAPYLLLAVCRQLTPPEHIVLRAADAAAAKLHGHWSREERQFRPFATVLALTDSQAADIASRMPFVGTLPRQGEVSRSRCANFTCQLPEIVE